MFPKYKLKHGLIWPGNLCPASLSEMSSEQLKAFLSWYEASSFCETVKCGTSGCSGGLLSNNGYSSWSCTDHRFSWNAAWCLKDHTHPAAVSSLSFCNGNLNFIDLFSFFSPNFALKRKFEKEKRCIELRPTLSLKDLMGGPFIASPDTLTCHWLICCLYRMVILIL